MDEEREPVFYTYKEAAQRVGRSIRSVNRWRRGGMPMTWAVRDGQRVRVVEERVLLKWFRERLDAWPAHQWKMRTLRVQAEQNAQNAHTSHRPDTPNAQ